MDTKADLSDKGLVELPFYVAESGTDAALGEQPLETEVPAMGGSLEPVGYGKPAQGAGLTMQESSLQQPSPMSTFPPYMIPHVQLVREREIARASRKTSPRKIDEAAAFPQEEPQEETNARYAFISSYAEIAQKAGETAGGIKKLTKTDLIKQTALLKSGTATFGGDYSPWETQDTRQATHQRLIGDALCTICEIVLALGQDEQGALNANGFLPKLYEATLGDACNEKVGGELYDLIRDIPESKLTNEERANASRLKKQKKNKKAEEEKAKKTAQEKAKAEARREQSKRDKLKGEEQRSQVPNPTQGTKPKGSPVGPKRDPGPQVAVVTTPAGPENNKRNEKTGNSANPTIGAPTMTRSTRAQKPPARSQVVVQRNDEVKAAIAALPKLKSSASESEEGSSRD